MQENFINNGYYTVSNVMMNFIYYHNINSVSRTSFSTIKKSRQTSILAKLAYKICTCLYEC